MIENPDVTPPTGTLTPHIALATSDFDATVERVRQTGFAFHYGPQCGPDGVLRAVTRDATGNTVEITDAPLRATEV